MLAQTPQAFALPSPPKGAGWYSTLDLPATWKHTQGAGVTVAVIDSGLQRSIGDLKGRVLPGIDLTGSNPGVTTDPPKQPNFGHGTDMAALIAGTGAGAGLIGVAPQAKILPIAVGNDASTTAVTQGIQDAVNAHVQVINLSVGGQGACTPDQGAAIANAVKHGIVVVAASGDDGTTSVSTPGNCPGAIAIGAVNAESTDLQVWSHSNSGPELDFVAPGYNMVDELLNNTIEGPFPDDAGTSQATAIASGTFALIRSKYPTASLARILQIATHNTHTGHGAASVGTRIDDSIGYGEILPFYAVTDPGPTTGSNPIWDQISAALHLGEQSTSPSTPSSGTTGTSSGAAPSTQPRGPSSPGGQAGDSSGSGGNSHLGAFLGILIAVLVIGAIILGVVLTRNRRRPPPARPF